MVLVRERRRFKRYHIAIDTTYLKVQGHGSIKSMTSTENIGLGGICAKMSSIIRVGDELLLELRLAAEQTLVAQAKVKWVLEGARPEANKYGLEFQWISSKSLLKDYLSAVDNPAVA